MIAVIVLDGAGYLLAVSYVPDTDPALISLLQDIFVAVAMLTVAVGLILPGMIGHAVEQVSAAADRLATGTLADLTRAMQALSIGDLNAAKARIDIMPVVVTSRDEVGAMADSFNILQREVGRTAVALDGAREGLAAAEDKLEYQALHDPLTGLPNRALLGDRLTQALRRAARKGSVAVLFVDLDQFKLINDSRGHRAGDELLREVATRLRAVMRPGDTVARFGGDEFCIVCDDVDTAVEAISIARRIIDELGRPYALETGEHFATASLGIALADGPSRPADDLIREADAAMYRAKEQGRGGYELFDEVMRGDATERLRLDHDLRRALDVDDELIAYYQPIVALPGGEIIGMEALGRWEHPSRGLVGPGEFIPVAEDSGAILALGERILQQACERAADWCERLGERPFRVSVNLAPRQVTESGLVALVSSVLERTGLPPAALALELTESALMEDSELVAENLRGLKALGVALMLDDFGTGYSSLAYLRKFPIDAIKIDRRFIAGLGYNTDDTTIVEAIIRMAAGLRLDVVAEGIETPAQATILHAMGCRNGQGFLWSRPVAPEHATALLDLAVTA